MHPKVQASYAWLAGGLEGPTAALLASLPFSLRLPAYGALVRGWVGGRAGGRWGAALAGRRLAYSAAAEDRRAFVLRCAGCCCAGAPPAPRIPRLCARLALLRRWCMRGWCRGCLCNGSGC